MDIEQQVEEICEMNLQEAVLGNVLQRTREQIRQALLEGRAYVWIKDEHVAAYAVIEETDHYLKIGSVLTNNSFRNRNFATLVVAKATIDALARKNKQVVAIANPSSEGIFYKLGYEVLMKEAALSELWGGRTEEDWLECDRKFMALPYSDTRRGEE